MRNFLLVGIPGVGKTRLGTAICQLAMMIYEPSGEWKRGWLKHLGIEKRLSELNQTESLLVNQLYFTDLRHRRWTVAIPVIVDTHATYKVKRSFVKLLPPDIDAYGIILLTAPPKTVKQRRVSRGRHRDTVNEIAIQREAEAEHFESERYARTNNIPMTVINTGDDEWWNHKLLATRFINASNR